ncbi:MAG: hypothetical protein KGM47_01655 [Acidobacteriota bacterium]|nr:hypothetical protein [Acidobacteriota bacterium]
MGAKVNFVNLSSDSQMEVVHEMDFEAITELDSGETVMYEVASWKQPEAFIKPASLGISIEESKPIAASIHGEMASDQVDQHNKALRSCRFCGRPLESASYS